MAAAETDVPELVKGTQSSSTSETGSEIDDGLSDDEPEVQDVNLYPLVLRGIHFVDVN